jgi:hypothetical protein
MSRGFIGEKGIGFKSCFRVTDEPHILSNGYQFKFDKNGELGYIVPIWVSNPKEILPIKEYENTNIFLPFKKGIELKKISKLLSHINMETLMFLRKLTSIEIINKINNESFLYEAKKINNNDEIKYVMKSTIRKNEKEFVKEKVFRLIKNIVYKPNEIKEEMREGLNETEILFGFEIDEINKKGILLKFLIIIKIII